MRVAQHTTENGGTPLTVALVIHSKREVSTHKIKPACVPNLSWLPRFNSEGKHHVRLLIHRNICYICSLYHTSFPHQLLHPARYPRRELTRDMISKMHRSQLCSTIRMTLVYPACVGIYEVKDINTFYPRQQCVPFCLGRFGRNNVLPKQNC